jgi:Lipopolysaccharide-assembly, LptC-related
MPLISTPLLLTEFPDERLRAVNAFEFPEGDSPMKRFRFLFLMVCMTAASAYAARQNRAQRLSSRLNLERQQPRLLLPRMNSIEMSALSMEREPASGITHLKGDAEAKMALGPDALTILRADEIIYDPNTGDIETRGQVTICTSGTIGPNGLCL